MIGVVGWYQNYLMRDFEFDSSTKIQVWIRLQVQPLNLQKKHIRKMKKIMSAIISFNK